MAKIAVFDLAVRYGKLTAIADLAFTVAEGERVFISGPNGAGKSSLLAAIAGDDRRQHNIHSGLSMLGRVYDRLSRYAHLQPNP
ncbi:ATP-binding cassette domain-containing protein [Pseudorhodobacter turbinis]|uniref:ATP-binding cassette domain-containing protein n=1 Tax=Pseudorhodobacter turbinis TaxID=2500533 RepID=A0A4P8ECS4_9RHOB|nr:ATP-binding cassette domain-containing protein [Pseudorhodobacter turbinis]QCO54517.1 ATP-binding cassette domain-containing protein [Pseudorhodobacter turbinis]